MNIGIIGSGHIGGTAARLFARAGHVVAVSNTRGPDSLSALVAEIGPAARALSVAEVAAFGEIVLIAIPFGRYQSLPADQLAGKIVVDATNYYPQRDGRIDLDGLASSELMARQLPGARLVKAFNTIYWERLANEGRPDIAVDERLAIFVAGDDAAAKAVVAHVIEQIGFAPVDTGSLHEGGLRQQPGSEIYNVPLTGAQARARLSSL